MRCTRRSSRPIARWSSTPWRRGRLLNAQYALGWRIYDYAGQTLIFHAGAVQGYRAMIAFLPKYRFGAVMLWNCESAAPSGLMPMLVDRYLGLPEVNWAGIDQRRNRRSRGRRRELTRSPLMLAAGRLADSAAAPLTPARNPKVI